MTPDSNLPAGWVPAEPTNTHGTGYGCACISRNAFACTELRYGYRDQQERCECLCHNWEDDDEH
jgi:hypothetical protein